MTGQPEFSLNAVFVAEPRSKLAIERVTFEFLAEWAPEQLTDAGPLDVERLVDTVIGKAFGYGLDIVSDSEMGNEAKCDFLSRNIVFSKTGWDRVCSGVPRSRFTACHEIYHVIDHSEQVLRDVLALARTATSGKPINRPVYMDPEWQAEHGAGALLMPCATIVPFIAQLKLNGNDRHGILEAIQQTFNVSYSAARAREAQMAKMGLI